MNTAIPDRYLPAADFEKLAQDFDFPVEVWTVAAELTTVTQATSPAELEKLTGLGSAQVKEALERLLAKKLVRQDVVSWKEFTAARAQARGTDKSTPAAKPANTPAATKTQSAKTQPAAAAVEPPASPEVQPPAPAAAPAQAAAPTQPAPPEAAKPEPSEPPVTKSPASEPVALRLGQIVPKAPSDVQTARISLKPAPNSPAAAIASEPAAAPEPESTPKAESTPKPAPSPEGIAIVTTKPGCLLRPILSKIENIKGGGVEGQLLVYQVFLRVPFQMLHDEGIKSLQLVDDKTRISNPELHAAIVKAAKEVTGIDLPPFEASL